MMFSSQAQNKCAALVRLTRQVLAFFCYKTHLEFGLGFGGFYFFEKEKQKGKTCTEVASAQGEHPASAGEKREIYNTVTRTHTCLEDATSQLLPAHPRVGDLSWSHSQLNKTEPTGTCWDPSKKAGFHFTAGGKSQQSVLWGCHPQDRQRGHF